MSYDRHTDYKALADQAANKGDYTQAAKYEQQRNEKIDGEGLTQYAKTSDYSAYLPTYSSTVKNELGHAATDVANIKDFSYDPSTDDAPREYVRIKSSTVYIHRLSFWMRHVNTCESHIVLLSALRLKVW